MENQVSWIDSHCHLEMLKSDLGEALNQCDEMAVNKIITIGTSRSSNNKILDLLEKDARIWGSFGCHPHEAKNFEDFDLDWMKNYAKNPKIVAIGECGLDYHYSFSEHETQKEVFKKQLELAVELDLPVIIHSREAEEDTMEIVAPFIEKGIRGVFHSFTASPKLAQFALDAGFYISFNGIATFPKSEEVRSVLKMTPLDRILIETDAPYLSPVPLRGRPNQPANVALVGKYIAEFLEEPEKKLASIIAENTLKLFPKINL